MVNRILRLPEVIRITGLSRSTIYLLSKKGDFPQKVPLGYRSIGWVEAEVQEWISKRCRHPEKQVAVLFNPQFIGEF